MGDVQWPEARAFYGFQLAIENIHSGEKEKSFLFDLRGERERREREDKFLFY